MRMADLVHVRIPVSDGLTLHAVTAGAENAPLVVLLHGFPEFWHSWRRQIPALAHAGFRVIAPDQRGYNLSDKPKGVRAYRLDALTADVAAILDWASRDKAVIVGHDWGGGVAWRFAMDYPERTERLVVMNAPHPVAFARELKRWSQRRRSWYMMYFQIPWLPETLFSLSPTQTASISFRNVAVRKDAFSDNDLQAYAQAMGQPGALRSMIHWYRAGFRYPPAKRVRPIESPTLLIWATEDVALGVELTRGLEKWIPNLTVHYVNNCGHWVQNEAPDEVNTALLEFLQADSPLASVAEQG
jgi:pimeloyl-ACP methyl ester carboxylesterase